MGACPWGSWNGTTIKAGGLGADGAREYLVFGDFKVLEAHPKKHDANVEAVRRAYVDAGREVPAEYRTRTAGARDLDESAPPR